MIDLKYKDKNNHKKVISAFASDIIEIKIGIDDVLFYVPEYSLITDAYLIVLSESEPPACEINLKVDGIRVLRNAACGRKGVFDSIFSPYYPDILKHSNRPPLSIKYGDVPPTNDAGRVIAVVEYIELQRTTGFCTS